MKKLLGLGLLAVASAAVSYGQAISVNGGSIAGTITDSSGAVLPNANITVTGTDTGFKKDLTSDSAGFYSVGPLNPGNYTVTIVGAGFQTLSTKTVVRTGTVTSGNFKLTVGQSSETIEVNAGQVSVNTEQAGVSDVITNQQIQSLPINGRNFLDVAQIEPGVILQSGQSFDPTKAGYSAISVSGVSGRTTRILLDGQDITDETVGTTIFNVSQGSINEFQLNRSTQDVSGDVTSTGQVLVSTTSGTNKFHGQGFYNFQDNRAGFATVEGVDAPFQRNQFGGSVGGPILRDKLFFFGNIERIKQDQSASAPIGSIFPQYQGLTVPSPYRETYSVVRLDYNGPLGGHYFVRGNYNVNSVSGNFGDGFETYANRDNTPGISGGGDFSTGKFTHSFRVSYEKFHNLIADTSGSAVTTINPLPGITFQNVAANLFTGPNDNAPQGTFQSDKQVRYDGTWTKGAHNVRYGYSLNRIQGGGFAAFFGLGARVRETASTILPGHSGSDPLNDYFASSIVLGNGLGFFTERPGFGLQGGGVADWREGAYVSDSWRIKPSFTFTAGLRWSVDTDRANQDLATPLCSDVDPSLGFTGCSGATPLFSQFRSDLGAKVHQPYANFAPQIGFAYAPGNAKTVLRGAAGIFFEGDVFNNTTNARGSLLKSGPFFNDVSVCGSGVLDQPDGTIVSSVTVGGVSQTIAQICSSSIASAAPYIKALNTLYQTNSAANSNAVNGGYVGQNLTVNGVYGAPYKTPYSEQFNFGIEREIFRGATLKADYVHNATLKIGQTQDVNHVGAARFLNTTAAQAAITKTLAACGATSITGALAACQTHPGGAGAANGPVTIEDFAANGLDSGVTYLGGFPSSFGLGVGPNQGAAFAGQNANLGTGAFILPIGRSGYDALQMVYHQVKEHPLPGIVSSNLQVSYSLSRIVTTNGLGTSDGLFNNASYDNDNPTGTIGRASLDHKHEVSFGGSAKLKYGPQVGMIGHFYSASPTSLTLDAGLIHGNIFQSDLTGDGTTGDLAPGTVQGDYMHRVKPGTLNSYISNFNNTKAGSLTPAGQALVTAGLFTQQQLVLAGGAVQPIASVPSARALSNPMTRLLDVNVSYPIQLARYREGLSLEPAVAVYNVGNFSNFGGTSLASGVLLNQSDAGGPVNTSTGYLNGPNTYDAQNQFRTIRGTGTFNQGAPRTIEYQLKLNF
ncbi:TonB-dependent receptor [Granulicella arctica]|uniref:TonB-dependent receptor n=1 Tax=Granulicella arctica TaxID=940613 RepID=UPI0021E0D8DB|nr:TonB-dependent receptor [Granulicella arctica]